jgi:pentatricopeptide repeat protein
VHNVTEKQGYLEDILSLMSSKERTVGIGGAVFEALISVYGSQGRFQKALSTFESIKGVIDKACLRSILLSCALSHPAKWEDAVSILHTSDIVAGTAGPGKIDQIALGNAVLACCKADQFYDGLNLLQLYGLSNAERYASFEASRMFLLLSAQLSNFLGFYPGSGKSKALPRFQWLR